MQVKLRVNRVGHERLPFSQKIGDIVEVSDEEAARLIKKGKADAVDGSEIETAMLESGKPRRRKKQ